MTLDSIQIDYIRTCISATAQSMLDGECSYVEGARQISDMLRMAKLERFEQPFVLFVAIDSETDDIPVGKQREALSPEIKTKLAPEWAKAEHYAKSIGENACRDIITWLAAHPFEVR